MPYFFVSHACGDDDAYVEEFFEDLCREVGAIAGAVGKAEIGFLGSHGTAEGDWSRAEADALATCQTFIPLCSPRFFLSETNGRQWWIFNQRLRRYAEETGSEPPSCIPVLWAPTDGQGDTFLEVPVDADQPRRALRQYLRLRSLRDQYRRYVTRLGERIVRTAVAHHIPPYRSMPPMSRTPNAFALLRTSSGAHPVVSTASRVHFVVAAASRDEMEQVRENLEPYGRNAQDWAPYRPALDRPLADRARAVAALRLLDSDVTDLSELRVRIEEAGRSNEMVVLLVDPWTTRLEGHRQILAEADRVGLAAAAVLVPLSDDDPESHHNSDELQYEVRQAISRYVSQPDALFRPAIQTPENFDADLVGVLEEGRNRMFKSGRPRHAPSGSSPVERPILQGP